MSSPGNIPPSVSPVATINPISLNTNAGTPLGQIGIGRQNSYRINIPNNKITYVQPNDTNLCRNPSAVIVALIVVIIVVAIILFYMFIETPNRDLVFNQILEPNLTSLDDEKLARLNTAFGVTFLAWIFVFGLTILRIEEPFKIAGDRSRTYINRGKGIEREIQNDIYIILLNLLFFVLAIFFIVYFNNPILSILFAILSLTILMFWKPKFEFFILAFFEVSLFVIYALKFSRV